MGIGHVAASPLTRSSYHARHAADAAAVPEPAWHPRWRCGSVRLGPGAVGACV